MAICQETVAIDSTSYDYQLVSKVIHHLLKTSHCLYGHFILEDGNKATKYTNFVREELLYKLPEPFSQLVELYSDCWDFRLIRCKQKNKEGKTTVVTRSLDWDIEDLFAQQKITAGLYTDNTDDYLLFSSIYPEEVEAVYQELLTV